MGINDNFTLTWRGDFSREPRGEMIISRSHFFPATKGRFAKLLKLFPRDVEERRYLLEENKFYIEHEIRFNEDIFKSIGANYMNYTQMVADEKRELETGKYPSGVRIPPAEIESLKKCLAFNKKQAKDFLTEGKSVKRKIAGYKANLDLINKELEALT